MDYEKKYNKEKPNGGIVLEDFNGGNGFYKVNLAYLSKEQVEEIEAIVSKWNPTDENIKDCIGMCLTDANEQRFKDYGTTLKDCLAWLEKQGKQKPKKLSIKEKAKRYDEALEIARNYHKQLLDEDNPEWASEIEKIFHELKESEDEKIRKALLEMVHDTTGDELWVDYNVHKEDALAWLEKQAPKPKRMVSAEAKEALYDKPKWGEEDKQNLNMALDYIYDDYLRNWLKQKIEEQW